MKTKIKFPTRLKIQGQTWTVEYCNVLERIKERGHDMDDPEQVLGFCCAPDRLICIEDDMSDGSKAEVLIHEVGHAANSILPSTFDRPEDDEQFAQIFATAVMDLFLNNDLKWLKAGS